MNSINLIGVITAVIFYISAITVFVFRIAKKPKIEYWAGIIEFLLIIPLIYLFINAFENSKNILYFIQIIVVVVWLIVELFLDYIFKIDFRKVKWVVIIYVMLFFAAGGGMIGIASNAGIIGTTVSIILFFVMGIMAFIQRKITRK